MQPADDLSAIPLRRVPTQARAREKVAKALVAAESIAASEGIEALSLTRVAGSAGLSVGALHQYLPDKDAIVAALVARYHARIELLMDEVTAEFSTLPETDPVGAVIDHITRIYREESDIRTLRSASRATDDAAAAHKARMGEKVHRLLVTAGVVSPSDTAVSRTLFVAADAVMHDAFGAGTEPDRLLLQELKTMILAYVRVQVAAATSDATGAR